MYDIDSYMDNLTHPLRGQKQLDGFNLQGAPCGEEVAPKFSRSRSGPSRKENVSKSKCTDTFQTIFKGLRSRSVIYNAIMGESTEAKGASRKKDAKSNSDFPYKCANCDHVFKFLSILLDHAKTHGALPKSFVCNICRFKGNKRAIKRHVVEKHV